MGKVALRQVFLAIPQFPLPIIDPPMLLHINHCPHHYRPWTVQPNWVCSPKGLFFLVTCQSFQYHYQQHAVQIQKLFSGHVFKTLLPTRHEIPYPSTKGQVTQQQYFLFPICTLQKRYK